MEPVRSLVQLSEAVEQAIFEFEDLARCVQEDLDDELHDFADEFESMTQQLKQLQSELTGRLEYANSRGLAFMPRVHQLRTVIPFYLLIKTIDTACRQGVRDV